MFKTVLLLSFTLLFLSACTATSSGNHALRGEASRIEDGPAEQFNNLFVLGNVYFAGQPTEAGLAWSKAQGVETVINTRTAGEALPYDEQAVADELGIKYVVIPITPDSFSVGDVEAFASVLDEARAEGGGVLIHCGSSNRVGGLWAAYLHAHHGMSPGEAIERGKLAGLRKDTMIEAAERVMEE